MDSQWFNWPERQLSLGTSQKVGFGTLNRAKNKLGMLKRPYPDYDQRYWFTRHPVERFKSLYKYIQTKAYLPRLVALKKLSPEQLLEHIERNWGMDTHWRSQCDHLGDTKHVTLLPLEAMGGFLPESVKRRNVTKSQDVELHPETVTQILTLYEQDLDLWLTSIANRREYPLT